MKLEQQLLINREWILNNNNREYWLINREWNSNNKYWSTGNEVRTATIDQEGMKLEQQLLINREWN